MKLRTYDYCNTLLVAVVYELMSIWIMDHTARAITMRLRNIILKKIVESFVGYAVQKVRGKFSLSEQTKKFPCTVSN